MLKRGSGTRHLPVFSNINSRAARVELLKQTRNNNNTLNNNLAAVTVSENNYSPNVVRATPSPATAEALHAVRGASPALAARSVRHLPGAHRQTFNVRNTEQPHRASLIGKQAIQTLKMTRRRRNSCRRRNTRRRMN